MDRNRITRTGARTPGEERHRPLEWRCLERTTAPTQSGDQQVGKRRARRKDANHEGATIGRHSWEGPFDKPTLKPYWGKPAVRNFRGDDGNVGIIRSPVRAIALPDLCAVRWYLRYSLSLRDVEELLINTDQAPIYSSAIPDTKKEGTPRNRCRQRPVQYLNNILEQDHRAIKRRVSAKQGFREFQAARRTIQGYEAVHMIPKGQVRWWQEMIFFDRFSSSTTFSSWQPERMWLLHAIICLRLKVATLPPRRKGEERS